MAKKIFKLESMEVSVRRFKLKEVRELIKELKVQGVKILEDSSDLQKNIENLITDNVDFVIEKIIQVTDLSKEQIEDMDVVDLVELIKIILQYNGISLGKLKNFVVEFLQPVREMMKETTQEITDNKGYKTIIPN